MDKNTESNIINIPKGFPDWDKPLMKNLHILEDMIKDIDDIDGLEDIKRDIKDLSYKIRDVERSHNVDITNVNMKINDINKQLEKIENEISNIDNSGLEKVEKDITELKQENNSQNLSIKENELNITKNKDNIQITNNNLDKVSNGMIENTNDIEDVKKRAIANKNDIDNLSKDLDEKISDVQINIDENKDSINKNKEGVNNNTKKIDEIKLSITKINENIKQMDKDIEEGLELLSNYHLIVSTTAEMGDLENVQDKSLCYVRKTGELFIYDGQWKIISTGEGGEISLEWNKIIGKPTSTPEYIDASVRNSHRHENMFVLDKITESKITEWNGKANKSDIPTKTSQLINDSGYVDDSKLNQSIQKLDNEINRLDKEKASQIDLDALREVVETLTGGEGGEIDLTEFAERLKKVEVEKLNTKDLIVEINKVNDELGFLTSETLKEDSSIKSINETLNQLNLNLKEKANKSEIPTKLSELNNDSEFITQDDVIHYDDSKLVGEINTLKDTKANKSEVPSKLSELENDSEYITLQEVPQFDDSDLKNSISQLEQNKANKEHTHLSSEVNHNFTTLDKELSAIDSNLKEKANKVDIPSKVSQLENDKGYITEADVDLTGVNVNIKELQENKADKVHKHSSNDISVDDKTLTETLKTINNTLDNKANNSELKTKLSEFENDTKFTTLDEVNQSDVIKNINVELAKKVDKSEKGKADGVVPLNKDSKIALEYLPDLSKQQTHIVETVEDMQKLENLLAGDKAFVVASGDSYIWNGTDWRVLSKAEWENINLDWANIINNPLTSDDLVNIPKIPTKADKKDIPIKISQLEDDKNITKDIQTLKDTKVDKVEGKTLTDNNYSSIDKLEVAKIKDKANVIHKHNIEDINTLTEKLAGINKAIASKAETSYVDKQIKEVKDLIDNIDIPEVDLSEINKSIADLEKNKAEFDSVIGDLETLTTKEKGELVGSINEVNKSVAGTNEELNKKVNKVDGKQLSTNDYTTVEKNKLSKLENYDDTDIKADIAKKVDKIEGKGLSTNDYSDLDKGLVSQISNKAEKEHIHKIEDITLLVDKLTNLDNLISNKAEKSVVDAKIKELQESIENIDIPEVDLSGINKQLADLTLNKADKEDVDSIVQEISDNKAKWEKDTIYDDTTIKNTITKKADTNYVDTEIAKKVDKVVGKELSTNDYSNIDKSEVSKIKNKADKTYVDSELKNKASNAEVNSIIKDIDDNRSKWEKDTIYDDSGIKNDLKTKADKTEILSIFTQENEPENMKIGDQWHQIVNN